MTDTTARLALPMIVPGQAQKEMSHNEALAVLDAAVQASVVAIGTTTPPTDPDAGACWIIGASATGAWAGHTDDLAIWTAGGWRFVAPTPGFNVWVEGAGVEARFVDGGWDVGTLVADRLTIAGVPMLATPGAPIADPAGGSTVDAEARSAIAAMLEVLRHHNLLETP